MTARGRVVFLALLLAATVSSCGQTGPLTLPENQRPIERVDAPANPGEQQQTDDERQDER
jgi:predicted small lipoprotein YifL